MVSDRRVIITICAFLGGIAYGIIYLVPTQWSYIVAFVLIMPFGGALFSQTFAFGRAYFDLSDPSRSEFMVSALRTVFAVSWVVVPPIAGWIASSYSIFHTFAVAAAAHAGFLLVFSILFTRSDTRLAPAVRKNEPGARTWDIPASRLAGIGGVTLIRIALAMHVTVIPLAIIKDLGGSLTDVGIIASVAAALEVPCMLAWGYATSRLSKETIIAVNGIIYGVYLGLVFFSRSVEDVLWLQALNAVATAALLSITISYMQETIRGRVGLSTSLMDVVTVASSLSAAGLFALLAGYSYVAVLASGGVLSLVGAIVVVLAGARRTI